LLREPVLKLTAALNGTIGLSGGSETCFSKFEITQNGTSACTPEQGPVEVTYDIFIAYPWIEKGNYTVHVRMTAISGARMTGFEGTVWVDGEADDGEGEGWM